MKLFTVSILFLVGTGLAIPVFGQTAWTGAANNGQWGTAGNWAGDTVPTGDAVIAINASISLPGAPTTVGDLTIESATVTLGAAGGANTFTASTLTVDGGGTLNLVIPAGGTFITTDTAISDTVGDGGGTGTMNLSGGGTLALSSTTLGSGVGLGGTGTFNQSGSTTVTVAAGLLIGADGNVSQPSSLPAGTSVATGGIGTYTITGSATLDASTSGIFVGVGSGTGGGAFTGGSTATTGILNINGGTVLAGELAIGVGAQGSSIVDSVTNTTGSVIQTAGVATIDTLEVGETDGAVGNYKISGSGVLTGTSIVIGDTAGAMGNFTQMTGSTVSTNGDGLFLGESGTGNYTMSGGALNVASGDIFIVGDQAGSTGVMAQTGGTVTFTAESDGLIVGNGGTGTYTLGAGGTLVINHDAAFDIGTGGGSGTFNYEGGTLTMASGLGVTIGSTGVFNQDASIVMTDPTEAVTIAAGGAYNLNAGTLQTGGSGAGAVFSGAGNFNFAGGTVLVTGSAWTDPLNGNVTGTSTIDTTNFGATLNGALAGTGTLAVVGGGTVILEDTAGDSSGSWGLRITGSSTVLATNVNSLSTNGSIVIGTGSSFFLGSTGAATDTFAGNISDVADGAGPATFITGTNTLVLSGVTNLDDASETIVGPGGGLEVDQGTISNITGAGISFVVGNGVSTGTVKLLGTNTIAETTVSAGSTLQAANITGDVTNNGTLGTLGTFAAPSALAITGDLTSTGTLLVNVNGATADSFTATTATLSGSVKVVGVGTNTYTLVSTTGGLTATVGSAPGDISTAAPTALFSSTLTVDGNDLVLTTTQKPLTSFAKTGNEAAVAQVLDAKINQGPPFNQAFSTLLLALNQVSVGQGSTVIPADLEELTPESLQYSRDIAFENASFMATRVNGVLANVRNGFSGLDSSGLSVIGSGWDSGLGRSLDSMLAYNSPPYYSEGGASGSHSSSPGTQGWVSDSAQDDLAHSGAGPSTPSESGVLNQRKFSEFISGDVVLADLNEDQGVGNAPSSKANYTSTDATAGVSYRMTSNLAAGVLFDYNHTSATTDASGSHTGVDTYSPGIYATYARKGFYVNGLASYGYNSYSNTRNVAFQGVTAHSSPKGNQYVGNLDFGYDFQPTKNWIVGPTLGLTYTHLDVDSFSENGGGFTDLSVNSQSADSLRSRLGGHVTYQTLIDRVVLKPTFTAMWQHEYLDDSSGITSQLSIPGTSPFTIQTTAPTRDSALLGCGLTASLDNDLAVYLNYLADVGMGDYFAQSVEGGFKAKF